MREAVLDASLEASCARLAELALRAGADEAEAFASSSASIAVRVEKGDLKLVQVDQGAHLGLRVFRERRLGFTATNQIDDGALERAASDAVALAAFSPPDEHNRLPEPLPVESGAVLAGADAADVGVEEAVARATDLVRRVRAIDRRLSIDRLELTAGRSQQAIFASTGARACESDAALHLSIFGMAVDGGDVGGFHYTSELVRTRAELEPACERLVAEFADTALGNLGAGRAESYRGAVLFSPDAFLDVFVEPLVAAASAIAVQRGRSPLAGRVGQSIAASRLSVRDDPSDPALAGCSRFDREGQPARPFPIVARGVLAGYLYNAYAAAVGGVRSTGHATGGARSVPGLGPHAVVVDPEPGQRVDGLRSSLGRGLEVGRFSGTVDPASGDFSGVAKSARWIEGGRIVRPVRETLLSGNAFELLAGILALSDRAALCGGTARAPHALVDGIAVTAG